MNKLFEFSTHTNSIDFLYLKLVLNVDFIDFGYTNINQTKIRHGMAFNA